MISGITIRHEVSVEFLNDWQLKDPHDYQCATEVHTDKLFTIKAAQ